MKVARNTFIVVAIFIALVIWDANEKQNRHEMCSEDCQGHDTSAEDIDCYRDCMDTN